ncbi:hypothetical protein [Agrobacterium sp. P15N1-A]|uniref:hypothetical protein n=1 Tax=Agrobacterium sp. P15N1-A TaxID=3342820 RepID=UPI0037DCDB70
MLAVFVTLGLSASVVGASDMAVKMATSSHMSAAVYGDCHDCDGGHSDKSKPMVCTVGCVSPVSVVFPHVGQTTISLVGTKLLPPKIALLFGSTAPPDPYPPRSIDLG